MKAYQILRLDSLTPAKPQIVFDNFNQPYAVKFTANTEYDDKNFHHRHVGWTVELVPFIAE